MEGFRTNCSRCLRWITVRAVAAGMLCAACAAPVLPAAVNDLAGQVAQIFTTHGSSATSGYVASTTVDGEEFDVRPAVGAIRSTLLGTREE